MRCVVFSDLHLHPWTSYSEATEEGLSRTVDQFNSLRQVFDYARKNGINDVFFLGDMFHSRKSLETSLLYDFFHFVRQTLGQDLNIIALAGNHDLTGTGKCFSNALLEGLPNYFFDKDKRTWIYKDKIAMLQWGTREDELPEAEIAMGHIEVQEVWYNKVMQEKKGIPLNALKDKYRLVILGHYHMHQVIDGKVIVVGSLNRLTRADKGLPKGFLDIELDSGEYKFVEVETFDFPEIKVDEKKHEEKINVRKELISFEEALKIWLTKHGRDDLIERAIEIWNSSL